MRNKDESYTRPLHTVKTLRWNAEKMDTQRGQRGQRDTTARVPEGGRVENTAAQATRTENRFEEQRWPRYNTLPALLLQQDHDVRGRVSIFPDIGCSWSESYWTVDGSSRRLRFHVQHDVRRPSLQHSTCSVTS